MGPDTHTTNGQIELLLPPAGSAPIRIDSSHDSELLLRAVGGFHHEELMVLALDDRCHLIALIGCAEVPWETIEEDLSPLIFLLDELEADEAVLACVGPTARSVDERRRSGELLSQAILSAGIATHEWLDFTSERAA
jgi:hypothetical protein